MKKNTNKRIIATVLMLVVLVLVTIGVTYAFFTYMKQGSTENTISTGSLTFIYDEKEAQGNGINMTNVFPVSDENGKALTGANNVFDFQVLATTKGAAINYEVIAEKVDSSTLPENMVKVYLTTLNGNTETAVETTVKNNIVTTYNELTDTSISGQTGKTLHQETIPSGQTNYNKQFRLRMWLSESASNQIDGEWDYNNKSFSIRVNVIANGEKTVVETKLPMMMPALQIQAMESSYYAYISEITTIVIENTIDIPTNAIQSWDVSEKQDKSVMAWITGTSSNYTLTIAGEGGVYSNTDSSYLFRNFSKVKNIDVKHLDTSKATNMEYMFVNCYELVNLDLSSFDTSNVTNMRRMFLHCTKLKSINIGSFDTSKVTIMAHMFSDCSSLISLNLHNFNTSQATDMSYMFQRSTSLTNLDVSSFDTSSSPNTTYMFSNTTNLTSVTLGPKWSNIIFQLGYETFAGWTPAQTIYVQGKKSEADFANVSSSNWKGNATVVYQG